MIISSDFNLRIFGFYKDCKDEKLIFSEKLYNLFLRYYFELKQYNKLEKIIKDIESDKNVIITKNHLNFLLQAYFKCHKIHFFDNHIIDRQINVF